MAAVNSPSGYSDQITPGGVHFINGTQIYEDYFSYKHSQKDAQVARTQYFIEATERDRSHTEKSINGEAPTPTGKQQPDWKTLKNKSYYKGDHQVLGVFAKDAGDKAETIDILNSSSGDSLITLAVNSAIYTKEDAEVLTRSYVGLLDSLPRNTATQVGSLPLYSDIDVSAAVELGRGPEEPSRWSGTIIDRIDDMTEAYGDRVALANGPHQRLSYRQMANRVNQLATELLARDVGRHSCIGLFQLPGTEWICSCLAILRAGAICVPLDLQIGVDRLLLIIKDCKPQIVLVDDTTCSHIDFLSSSGTRVLDTSKVASLASNNNHFTSRAVLEDAAIIIYISGSTGVPKGVILKHHSLQNFTELGPPRWGLQEGKEVILQQSSYVFDMALCQIFTCLGYGGTLVVVNHVQRRDPISIRSIIALEGVTFTMAIPTEYLTWIQHECYEQLRNTRWRKAMSGGEAITKTLVEAFRLLQNPDFVLVNAFGPTETSFACADGIVPLGQELDVKKTMFALSSLPNYSICVVDDNLEPLPSGVPGQVLIGGAGVGSGYLNQQQLNDTAFVPDKQASSFFEKKGWVTAHTSGDRGRFDASGHLVLEGRVQSSTQIKIGGIRMDLEDIENTILKVMAPRARQDYMWPSLIVEIDSIIPTTISNKVDRLTVDSLPLPDTSSHSNPQQAFNSSKFEEALRLLWEETIPREMWTRHAEIVRDSDFFHVGGSSLALLNLQALIRDRLSLSVSLNQLFRASTLRKMTCLLQGQHDKKADSEVIDWEIYCIAVRTPKEQLPQVFADPKVTTHDGDLSESRLGLSEENAHTIFNDADAVLHLGADVSFLKTYRTLYPANVDSTKELVRLSLPRLLSFHFVSTAAVAQLSSQETLGPVSVAQYPPSPVPGDGYVAIKWVCEVYLEHASRAFGLPAVVHRPSSVTGKGGSEADLMSNVLEFARLTNTVPKLDASWGFFDFVSVQATAEKIVEELLVERRDSGDSQEKKWFEALPLVEWIVRLEKDFAPKIG
ncbi:hypothetical protein F4781DRAFT_439393 [Annulohypoxylon bovei var. microspora]|nr:hypothetical protein F4781DRAFT_439393 [Annulohypoxylon bovei var. microspora]